MNANLFFEYHGFSEPIEKIGYDLASSSMIVKTSSCIYAGKAALGDFKPLQGIGENDETITDFATSSLGSLVAISYSKEITLNDFVSNMTKKSLETKNGSTNLIFSRDGRFLIIVDTKGILTLIGVHDGHRREIKKFDVDIKTVFHPGFPQQNIIVVLGTEILCLDSSRGRALWNLKRTFRDAAFSLDGLRLFIVGEENELDVYDTDKINFQPNLIRKVKLKFLTPKKLILSPDDRILFVLSDNGWELLDITVPEGETSLIWASAESHLTTASFLPDGKIILGNTDGIVLMSRTGFVLEEMRNESRKIQLFVDQYKEKLRRIPQWIVDGETKTINDDNYESRNIQLEEVNKELSPRIRERLSMAEWPFWAVDVFKHEMERISQLEENLLESGSEIRKELDIHRQKDEERKIRFLQVQENCIQYIRSFSTGTSSRIPVEQIADYLGQDQAFVLRMLTDLDQKKLLPNSRLQPEVYGKGAAVVIGGSETMPGFSLDGQLCYFCSSPLQGSMECGGCGKPVPICGVCGVSVLRGQDALIHDGCNRFFHLSCFLDKVGVFGRCPVCKSPISIEKAREAFQEQESSRIRVTSSLSRMFSIYKQTTKVTKENSDNEF